MRLYPDDEMFYGIVATNTVQGAPFSFDGGVSRTTGFHWAGLFPPLAAAAARRALFGGGAYRDFFDAIFRGGLFEQLGFLIKRLEMFHVSGPFSVR